MEPVNETRSASIGARQPMLQSVEDFMREQDEADALRDAKAGVNIADISTKKQLKTSLQVERDRLEAEQKEKKAALEAEKRLAEQQAKEAVEQLGAVNWVGRLLEYRNAHPMPAGGLTYAEETVGLAPPRFACTALIHESSQHFGKMLSFSNKKDAKRYASKKAVEWLIENRYMPADGSVKFPKALPPPVLKVLGPVRQAAPSQSATPSPVGTPRVRSSISYAGQIPELCSRLGFSPPTYEITKVSENTAFWSGYAHFGGDPRIEGKIGRVKSVFGKANAKEQIAMEVLSFLKDIERQRVEMENKEEGEEEEEEEEEKERKEDNDWKEEDRKRKRDPDSVSDEISGKVVKVVA